MTNRIHWENEEEIGNALGDTLADMAWPGVFTSGKRIIATKNTRRGDFNVMMFTFSDGSVMNIIGTFEVRYKQPPEYLKDDVVDHDAVVEQGKQLMSGQLSLEEGDAEE